MINIYAFYFKDPANNGQIRTSRKLIQSVPAGSESKIRILSATSKCDFGNAESMDFTLQPGTEYYDAFIQFRSYILVEYDGDVIFYGRVLNISNGFFGEQKLHCEGALAFLNDSYYPGSEKKERKDITIYAHMTAVINNHNSQVDDARKKIYLGEVPGNYTSATSSAQRIANASREFGASNWSTSKSVLEDLKSHYGGAFRIRYVLDTYSDKIGQYGEGNIDLNNRIVVHNPDGSISTEVSITITVGRKYVLIPTVINGRIVSDNEAINYYYDHNKYLGKFDTLAAADDYAIRLHERQDWYYNIRPYANKCYLDWVNHYFRSTVNSQTIEVGKNLIDISGSTEISNIFTVIIPIGKTASGDNPVYLTGYTRNGHTFGNTLTVPEICSSVYNYGIYTDSQLNSGYHQAADYKESLTKYGRIFKTVEFQEAHDQKTLFEKACDWIKSNYQGGVDTFSVKAIDLHLIGEDTGKILLGDRVKIKYPVGMTTDRAKIVARTLTCTSVNYDLFNPENNQYTFGIPANMLGKTYGDSSNKKQKKSSSSYKPPSGNDDNEPEDTYTKWVNSVRSRLRTLLVWKKSTGGVPTGPTGSHPDGSPFYGTYLQQIVSKDEHGTKWVLWEPYSPTLQKEYGPVFRSYYVWPTSSNGRTLIYRGDFGSDIILSNKLIAEMNRVKLFDFIWYEHGIDLRQGGGGSTGDDEIKMPSLIPNENGGTDIYGSLPGLLGGVTSKIGEIGNGSGENLLSLLAGNGELQTVIGSDGVTKYLKDKPDGTKVQISIDPDTGGFVYTNPETGEPATIRDLHLEAKNSADFIGSIVTEGYAGPDGQIHIYKFGQGIEKWGNGELVVAYVDGDIVRIGTRTRTKRIYLTADQVILGDSDDAAKNVTDALIAAGVIDDDTLAPNSLVLSSVYAHDINGINGRFQTIESQYLKTTLLSAKIAELTTMTVKSINAFTTDGSGIIIAKTLESPDIRLRSTTGTASSSIRNIFVSGIELAGPDANNYYTLIARDVDSNELYRKSFSRAVSSFTGTWSGNHYQVLVSPQNQVGGDTYTYVRGDDWTNDHKKVVHFYYFDSNNEQVDILTATVNATSQYNDGRNYVNLTEPTWNVITGSTPSHRTVSVSTTGRPTSVTKSVALYLTQGSFSNHKKYVFMRTNSTTGTVYAEVEVDATSEYNSGKYNWNNNASLYCSDISYGSTGTKTVTLIVSYSASQSVPFSVGSSKRVYFD